MPPGLALALLASGLLSGLLAGLLGIGGGLVLVPAFLFLLPLAGIDGPHNAHLALGSSLAVIVPTAVVSAWRHHRHGAVRGTDLRALLPGVAFGAALGAALAHQLSSPALARAFGAFELLVAADLVARWRPPAARRRPPAAALAGAGVGTGTLSSLLGIGGGTLHVPLLLWLGRPLPQAIGTAAALGLPIALAGAAAYAWLGRHGADLPPGSVGYLYPPLLLLAAPAAIATAPLGVRLAHRLPVDLLRRLFAGVLALAGLKLLLSGG